MFTYIYTFMLTRCEYTEEVLEEGYNMCWPVLVPVDGPEKREELHWRHGQDGVGGVGGDPRAGKRVGIAFSALRTSSGRGKEKGKIGKMPVLSLLLRSSNRSGRKGSRGGFHSVWGRRGEGG